MVQAIIIKESKVVSKCKRCNGSVRKEAGGSKTCILCGHEQE